MQSVTRVFDICGLDRVYLSMQCTELSKRGAYTREVYTIAVSALGDGFHDSRRTCRPRTAPWFGGLQFTSTARVSVKRERSGSRRVKRSRSGAQVSVTITARLAADWWFASSGRGFCHRRIAHECIRRIEETHARTFESSPSIRNVSFFFEHLFFDRKRPGIGRRHEYKNDGWANGGGMITPPWSQI